MLKSRSYTVDSFLINMVLLNHFQHETNPMRNNAKLFDIIVLAGMVVNILLAVFLILYYFDFL